MEKFEGFDYKLWNPFSLLGIEHNLLKINADTIIDTWIALGIILLLALIARMVLKNEKSIIRYFVISTLEFFIDLTTKTIGTFIYKHFAFVTALFIFILTCNWVALIPTIHEPTKDLNTALAVGLISFFYKDYQSIKAIGLGAFFKEFIHPFFIMFPLNVIAHCSKVISMSFRLFGNIFGGSIISDLYIQAVSSSIIAEIIGLSIGANFIVIGFFIIFEGFIQAFVFSMLSLTYLAIALQTEEEGGQA